MEGWHLVGGLKLVVCLVGCSFRALSQGGGFQKKVFGQGGQATHLINQGGAVVISWERGLEGGYFL